MNLSVQMIPGLCALMAGAVLGLGAGRLCHREKDVPQMKLLGAGLAVIGAILIFLP
ncbi:MAG TPA: hypothetical protein IAC49_09430 [Candidatus Ventricola intestinavium]|nr:hypothetical protein [Candidatus Ventricola intestinavium]